MTAKKLKACLWLAALALTACQSGVGRVEIPGHVISPDSMQLILLDIHLIEGAKVGQSIEGNDSLNIRDYYHHIWNKYSISKDYFDESFSFYTGHPGEMQKIYVGLIDTLTAMEAHLESEAKDTTGAIR